MHATLERIRALGRPFQLLLISEIATLLSLMVGHITLPWWIAERGGAHDLALYGGVMSAGAFVFIPLLSPLGDRYPKRTLMSAAMFLMAAEGLLLALLAQSAHYHLPSLIVLELISVAAMAVASPCAMSIAAELVPAEQLADAIGLQKSAQAAGRLLGPAVGGIVLALGGIAPALWLHMGLLLLSGWLASRMRCIAPSNKKPFSLQSWWNELHAGLHATWLIRVERARIAVNFLVALFFIPAVGMLAPLRVQALGLSAGWLGAAEASLSLGLLIGALGGAQWLSQCAGRYRALIGSMMAEGLALMLVGLCSWPPVMVGAFFLVGFFLSAVQLVGQTHRQLATPASYRARLSSVGLMVMQIAGTLGPALTGLALLHLSVGQVYASWGLLMALSCLGFLLIQDFRGYMALDHEQVKDWFARRYPEAFSDLGPSTAGKIQTENSKA